MEASRHAQSVCWRVHAPNGEEEQRAQAAKVTEMSAALANGAFGCFCPGTEQRLNALPSLQHLEGPIGQASAV